MKHILTATLLAVCTLLAACSSSSIINYRGGALKGVIKIEKSAGELTEGGLPQARAVLLNDSSTTTKFEYKLIWLDANDMPVDEIDRPWRSVTLSGNDTETIRGTGPSDRAKRFQIQIRKPQGVTE